MLLCKRPLEEDVKLWPGKILQFTKAAKGWLMSKDSLNIISEKIINSMQASEGWVANET